MGWKGGVYIHSKAYKCRNPLSLDMGWKVCMQRSCLLMILSRNPLSLDMGWKGAWCWHTKSRAWVAIRFRWIWVEKKTCTKLGITLSLSQSAFAGYGLKSGMDRVQTHPTPGVAIRFRWIWVEKTHIKFYPCNTFRRNPLSLDMGWKVVMLRLMNFTLESQSAFAGYGLKRLNSSISYGSF